MKFFPVAVVFAAGAAVICGQTSEWAKVGSGGRLQYRTTERGDRIMDFSYAGFTGSTERAPGIAFSNRRTAGSGHGWDIGWAVAWNVRSAFLLVEQPPGAINWCIGCAGTFGGAGPGPRACAPGNEQPYLAQLRERVGQSGLKAIGYTSR